MSGDDFKKAVNAMGNGGAWAAAYRISVWAFCTLIAVTGYFAQGTLKRIENNQIAFDARIVINERTLAVHEQAIKLNTTTATDRYTGQQARRDWSTQERVDEQQDTDRARVERRVERVEQKLNQ